MQHNYPLSIVFLTNDLQIIQFATTILESEQFNLAKNKELFFLKDIEEAAIIYEQLCSVQKIPSLFFISDTFFTSPKTLDALEQIKHTNDNAYIICITDDKDSSAMTLNPQLFNGYIYPNITASALYEHIESLFQHYVNCKTSEYFDSVKEGIKWK